MKKDSAFNNEKSFLNSWYNLRKGFLDYFKDQSEDLDINPAETMFISKIYYQEGISQREMARELFVSEANITKTFKKLEDKGLVYKTIDKRNNARRKLHLTEKGERIFEESIKIYESFDSLILEGYDETEKEAMEQRIKNIADKSMNIIKK